mmetsp:Transcript_72523/g.234368  ORF Transcript_72523/g.234368 Transcript_72523/m.234368 type:complete len:100 (-) Transcript_72523:130-429(-)
MPKPLSIVLPTEPSKRFGFEGDFRCYQNGHGPKHPLHGMRNLDSSKRQCNAKVSGQQCTIHRNGQLSEQFEACTSESEHTHSDENLCKPCWLRLPKCSK